MIPVSKTSVNTDDLNNDPSDKFSSFLDQDGDQVLNGSFFDELSPSFERALSQIELYAAHRWIDEARLARMNFHQNGGRFFHFTQYTPANFHGVDMGDNWGYWRKITVAYTIEEKTEDYEILRYGGSVFGYHDAYDHDPSPKGWNRKRGLNTALGRHEKRSCTMRLDYSDYPDGIAFFQRKQAIINHIVENDYLVRSRMNTDSSADTF